MKDITDTVVMYQTAYGMVVLIADELAERITEEEIVAGASSGVSQMRVHHDQIKEMQDRAKKELEDRIRSMEEAVANARTLHQYVDAVETLGDEIESSSLEKWAMRVWLWDKLP